MNLSFNSDDYLQKHPTWHAEDSAWKADQVLKMLDRAKLTPKYICDVGCGAGVTLRTLQSRLPSDARLVGYEMAAEAYAICSKLANDRLSFVLGDPLEADARYDLACCLDVIEHLEDYLNFLRRLRPLAKHHIFHIPLEISIERLLRSDGFVAMRRKYNHLHHFTAQTARAALKDAGYEIADQFYTPSEIVLSPKSLGQALARLPRRLVYALHKGLAARTTGGVSLMVLAH